MFRAFDATSGYGSSWRLVTKPSTDDVYLEHIEGGRWVHSSFHKSGESHYATTKAPRAAGGPGTPRYVAEVPDRFAVAPGVFLLVRIAVARSELSRDWTERGTPPTVIDVPMASDGTGLAFEAYLVEDPEAVVGVEGEVVAIAVCGGGSMLYLIATPLRLDVGVHVGLYNEIAEIQSAFRAKGWTEFPIRVAISMQDPEMPGVQREVEVLLTSDGA